jgi:integrase
VPLTERVRGAIADYLGSLKAVPLGPVFRSRVGANQAISRVQAHRVLKGLARELGLSSERLGCHSARKHFALSIWRRSNFNLVQVQRVLGHSSPLVSAMYLDTSRDELDALVLGLDQPPAALSGMPLAATFGTSV